MADTQFALASPPSDGIASVRWSPVSELLVSASWDKTVRVHDANQNAQVVQFQHETGALDATFGDDDAHVFSVGLDRRVLMHDVASGGRHGRMGRQRVLWDPRHASASAATSAAGAAATMAQSNKVFSLALTGYRLVVCTAERHVNIYDIRNTAQPEQRRLSSLKHQTRAVRISPDQQSFVMSSIEGRVAVEYFDMSAAQQARKYAFKCHRTTVGETQYVFPVNAIAFHPVHGTFATGGCDSMVAIWDGEQKKRITQLPAFPTSIAALDFSRDGSLLAVASSYTFEEGDKDHPADQIFVRRVQDSEVRPKSKAK